MAVAQTAASQSSGALASSGQASSTALTPATILATVASEAGLDPDKVGLDATLEGLDIGSLDLISILFALEEQFAIEIVPEDIDLSWTVAEFAAYVASLPTK